MIIESDWLIPIQAIKGEIRTPSQSFNLIEDIIASAKDVEIIKFLYCNKLVNGLEDMIAKRAHRHYTQTVFQLHIKMIFIVFLIILLNELNTIFLIQK